MNTAEAIQGAFMSPVLKAVAEGIRATTAAAIDINAANLSLGEKAVLRSALAGTETQVSVNAALIDPPLKDVVLGS